MLLASRPPQSRIKTFARLKGSGCLRAPLGVARLPLRANLACRSGGVELRRRRRSPAPNQATPYREAITTPPASVRRGGAWPSLLQAEFLGNGLLFGGKSWTNSSLSGSLTARLRARALAGVGEPQELSRFFFPPLGGSERHIWKEAGIA